ncbi:DAZ-associated protein 2 [Chionoecetes opilio]|uniref:DAZ-associated protein 2 n=1 Tax=Chionoecetes opilio TaxID=41210 RepID=A0A8J8WN63_CHIOP|nr:DAZ-associated protein 2 [Chionoecetes opilio]
MDVDQYLITSTSLEKCGDGNGNKYLTITLGLRYNFQNIAAAQQAQKVALSHQAQQQHQAALYMQQQPQQMYLQQVPGYFQHPQAAAAAVAASQSPYAPGQNVLVLNGYDSGARFDGMSQASIPPPPPGVAPNAAQLAAASGAHVGVSQKKGSFLSGGSGGGYTIF